MAMSSADNIPTGDDPGEEGPFGACFHSMLVADCPSCWWGQAQRCEIENRRLRAKVERLTLILIEVTNPGIDMEKVKASRADD